MGIIEEMIRQDKNPDGSMKPEYRQRLRTRGFSESEIAQMEERSIRTTAIDRQQNQWKQELQRQQTENRILKEQQKQQRKQEIFAIIQRSIIINQSEVNLSYQEGEKICSDLELIYFLKDGVLTPPQAAWLVQFLVQVLGGTLDTQDFYINRINEIIHTGSLSSETLVAIDEKFKQMNIALPPFSVYKGNTINFEKSSSSKDRRAFAMAGLDREELLSQGFLEPDDFYEPKDEAEEADQVYERSTYEPPDIPF